MPKLLTYSYRSIAVRKGSSAMAVLGIALVVIVFVVVLALGEGFRQAVAASGNPRNLIVLRKGADAELNSQLLRGTGRIIAEHSLVASDAQGPLFIFESLLVLNRAKKGGGYSNIAVRGTEHDASRVHTDVKLQSGRWFTPGTAEAVIGASLARRVENFSIGKSVSAGKHNWTIVGIFDADGSGLESEMWIDGAMLQAVFKRGDIFQSFLFRTMGDPVEAVRVLTNQFEADPRINGAQVMTETEYYAKQSRLMSDLIVALGVILTIIMAVGGIVGAMNTMYAAVSHRKREIGCILAMGFTPEAIWLSFVIESMCLSLLGAAIGCGVSLYFDGLRTGTTNWATFSETAFTFEVTNGILITASCIALFMGFLGGFLPALQAARLKPVDALRRA